MANSDASSLHTEEQKACRMRDSCEKKKGARMWDEDPHFQTLFPKIRKIKEMLHCYGRGVGNSFSLLIDIMGSNRFFPFTSHSPKFGKI